MLSFWHAIQKYHISMSVWNKVNQMHIITNRKKVIYFSSTYAQIEMFTMNFSPCFCSSSCPSFSSNASETSAPGRRPMSISLSRDLSISLVSTSQKHTMTWIGCLKSSCEDIAVSTNSFLLMRPSPLESISLKSRWHWRGKYLYSITLI